MLPCHGYNLTCVTLNLLALYAIHSVTSTAVVVDACSVGVVGATVDIARGCKALYFWRVISTFCLFVYLGCTGGD